MPESTAPPAAVRLDRVTVRYGATTAVADVSLAIAPGEVYALLGRNGAGKSSLLRVLLGQQRAAVGRAEILGHDAWRRRATALTEVGVVPEEPDAPADLAPRRLATFCARLYPRWDAAGFAARLARFAVPAERPFGQLSKGQKAQVALALALATQPRLLVLDDPTLGLDVVARRDVFDELIGELADRGTTVLLATHELAAVERLALRVAFLDQGRLVLDAELEELRARWRRLRLPAAAGGDRAALAARLARFRPGAIEPTTWGCEVVVSGFAGDAQAEAELEKLAAVAEPMTLEEIFLARVGEESTRSAA